MNLPLIIKLLLWLPVIEANVWADATGRKPNYALMFVLRGMAWIFHMVLWVPGDWAGTDFSNGVWLGLIGAPTVFDITSFWLLFEVQLNIIRTLREKQKLTWSLLLYYDHKEGDSGWIDKFFKWLGPKWGPRLHTTAKVLCLILCILSIINLYTRY